MNPVRYLVDSYQSFNPVEIIYLTVGVVRIQEPWVSSGTWIDHGLLRSMAGGLEKFY